MFTGIIEALGKVVKCDGEALEIQSPFRRVRQGESISIDGVCLTVTRQTGSRLMFDVGPETRRVTTLGKLKPGERVNLERALQIGDRLGGHWVTGHVEETGTISRVAPSGPNRWITIKIPRRMARYIVPKGSLAVDGISLTIVDIRQDRARLMIIPHTLSHTTLGRKKPGDRVNLEPDIMAKYAEKIRLHP